MAVLGPRFCAKAFSSCGKRGATPHRGARASHHHGLSRCGAQAPDAQAQQLWLTGPVAPRHVGSSQTRARTRVPCLGRRTLNHCATREAPWSSWSLYSLYKLGFLLLRKSREVRVTCNTQHGAQVRQELIHVYQQPLCAKLHIYKRRTCSVGSLWPVTPLVSSMGILTVLWILVETACHRQLLVDCFVAYAGLKGTKDHLSSNQERDESS